MTWTPDGEKQYNAEQHALRAVTRLQDRAERLLQEYGSKADPAANILKTLEQRVWEEGYGKGGPLGESSR